MRNSGDGTGDAPTGPDVIGLEHGAPGQYPGGPAHADTLDRIGALSACRPTWTLGPFGGHGGAMLTAQQLADLERVMAEDDRTAPEPTDEQLSRLSELLWPYVPRVEAC